MSNRALCTIHIFGSATGIEASVPKIAAEVMQRLVQVGAFEAFESRRITNEYHKITFVYFGDKSPFQGMRISTPDVIIVKTWSHGIDSYSVEHINIEVACPLDRDELGVAHAERLPQHAREFVLGMVSPVWTKEEFRDEFRNAGIPVDLVELLAEAEQPADTAPVEDGNTSEAYCEGRG